MTHRYFQNQLAGADEPCRDATELKEELDEDRVCYVVLFPVDQLWSPVGEIGDIVAFGVVFILIP